jgi:site-specific recombinase XerD
MTKQRGVDKDVFGFCGWSYLLALTHVCINRLESALISSLFETGGRVSEVITLESSSFHFNRHRDPRIVVIEMSVSKRRKGPNRRVFPIRSDEPLAPYMLNYARNVNGKLFDLSRVSVFNIVRRVGQRLAKNRVHPDFSAIKSHQLYPHWFRAQRASQLRADYGFDSADLKDFFYWTRREEMPSVYSRLSWEQLAEKMLKKGGFQTGGKS